MTLEYLRYERQARDAAHMDVERNYGEYLSESEWLSVARALPPPGPGLALEAGCGPGRFLRKLLASGYPSLVGLDISYNSVAAGRQALGGDVLFVQGELHRLPLAPGTFSTVFCMGVLQAYLTHEDAASALRDLARVVRPGGDLVLTTWNYQLGDRLRGTRMRRDSPAGFNYYKYSKSELTQLVTRLFPADAVRVWNAVHFHRKPLKLGGVLAGQGRELLHRLDALIERTPLSAIIGHLVVVHLRKRAADPAAAGERR